EQSNKRLHRPSLHERRSSNRSRCWSQHRKRLSEPYSRTDLICHRVQKEFLSIVLWRPLTHAIGLVAEARQRYRASWEGMPERLPPLEREMTRAQRDFKPTEVVYGQDIVALVIATGYVEKLIRNARIARYLADNHPEMLNEFRKIVSAISLDTSEAVS